MFAPQPTAARGGSEDACVRWTQKQLVIGNDLQSRRFVLEPKGGLEEMPVFQGGRRAAPSTTGRSACRSILLTAEWGYSSVTTQGRFCSHGTRVPNR